MKLFDGLLGGGEADRAAVEHLEHYHQRGGSLGFRLLLAGFVVFVTWACLFRLDEVAKASGEVIASSRVQIIQAVDGGVLAELNVREGDQVKPGEVLARLDPSRLEAAVREIEARLVGLKAKAARLRAEVTGAATPAFPPELAAYGDQLAVERALFQQRRTGLAGEIRTLQVAVRLAREELELTRKLVRSGDANRSEEIHAEKSVNDAEAALVVRQNRFFEEASAELAKAEDDIAQNEQVLAQRRQQLKDSVFVAQTPGVVKNVRVTTVGGVLRAGEELMQIVPTDDQLIVEAKVAPADIARVQEGLQATIRFDPFDYTIYGSVAGKVVYVSADTIKEDSSRGKDVFYRVHVSTAGNPVTTSNGRKLDILPGMTAKVDIRTGQRTLMSYLLKPLRKTLTESFGER